MKFHIAIPLTVVAFAASAFHVAQAQTVTREEVKAQAIAAAASKPTGEMSTPNQDKGMRARPSNTTRAAVKADLAAARPLSQGEQNTPSVGMQPSMAASKSTKSRAAVKSEAVSAEKTSKGGLSRGNQSEGVSTAASAAAPKP